MAQLDYYGTWSDSFTMLAELLADESLQIYLDRAYARPEPERLVRLTPAIQDHLRAWRRLYIFGPFSTHPPLFTNHSEGVHAGKFLLAENGGGPLLTLALAGDNLVQGQRTLVGGDLSSQRHYQVEPGRWEPATSELKTAYTALSRVMKTHLQRYRGAVWMGPEAAALYDRGQARIIDVGTLQDLARAKAGRAPSTSTPPAPPIPKAAQGG